MTKQNHLFNNYENFKTYLILYQNNYKAITQIKLEVDVNIKNKENKLKKLR